jgi:hypothetical protein
MDGSCEREGQEAKVALLIPATSQQREGAVNEIISQARAPLTGSS